MIGSVLVLKMALVSNPTVELSFSRGFSQGSIVSDMVLPCDIQDGLEFRLMEASKFLGVLLIKHPGLTAIEESDMCNCLVDHCLHLISQVFVGKD